LKNLSRTLYKDTITLRTFSPLSISLTLTQMNTHILTYTLSDTQHTQHTRTLSLLHTHTHTHSQTHKQKHAHTLKHTLTFWHTLSLTLTHSTHTHFLRVWNRVREEKVLNKKMKSRKRKVQKRRHRRKMGDFLVLFNTRTQSYKRVFILEKT